MLALAPRANAQCFDISRHFPLQSGNFWNYSAQGSGGSASLSVLNGSTSIGGVATKALRASGNITTYMTNDANGLRLYRRTAPIEGTTVTVTYGPRIPLANPTACVGQALNDSGIATLSAPGFGSAQVNYSSNGSVERTESISVPAGTFTTVRLRWVTRLFGTVLGESIDQTIIETNWLADGIGPVQQRVSAAGQSTTVRLTGSNLLPRRVELGIVASGADAPVNSGQVISLRLTATNRGPESAREVMVKIGLPPGAQNVAATSWFCTRVPAALECRVPTLAVGEVSFANVTMTAPAFSAVVDSEITINSNDIDTDESNNRIVKRITIIADGDNDGVGDADDNCPAAANPGQGDNDDDGAGDACDADDDNDGVSDAEEIRLGRNPLVDEAKAVLPWLLDLLDD